MSVSQFVDTRYAYIYIYIYMRILYPRIERHSWMIALVSILHWSHVLSPIRGCHSFVSPIHGAHGLVSPICGCHGFISLIRGCHSVVAVSRWMLWPLTRWLICRLVRLSVIPAIPTSWRMLHRTTSVTWKTFWVVWLGVGTPTTRSLLTKPTTCYRTASKGRGTCD